jgi:hypothetical protein
MIPEIEKTSEGARDGMEIDKDKVVTQEETGEPAAIDKVEERVEAEMKRAEGRAKEQVGQGLGDNDLEREGRELQEGGEQGVDSAS